MLRAIADIVYALLTLLRVRFGRNPDPAYFIKTRFIDFDINRSSSAAPMAVRLPLSSTVRFSPKQHWSPVPKERNCVIYPNGYNQAMLLNRNRQMKIEKGSNNVYADIGMPDAGEMLVKAHLAAKIGEIVKQRRLTQQQAAEILGMTQPKLSNMLRGQFRGISEARMLDCLNRLGRDVEIVVRKAARSRHAGTGRTKVVFA